MNNRHFHGRPRFSLRERREIAFAGPEGTGKNMPNPKIKEFVERLKEGSVKDAQKSVEDAVNRVVDKETNAIKKYDDVLDGLRRAGIDIPDHLRGMSGIQQLADELGIPMRKSQDRHTIPLSEWSMQDIQDERDEQARKARSGSRQRQSGAFRNTVPMPTETKEQLYQNVLDRIRPDLQNVLEEFRRIAPAEHEAIRQEANDAGNRSVEKVFMALQQLEKQGLPLAWRTNPDAEIAETRDITMRWKKDAIPFMQQRVKKRFEQKKSDYYAFSVKGTQFVNNTDMTYEQMLALTQLQLQERIDALAREKMLLAEMQKVSPKLFNEDFVNAWRQTHVSQAGELLEYRIKQRDPHYKTVFNLPEPSADESPYAKANRELWQSSWAYSRGERIYKAVFMNGKNFVNSYETNPEKLKNMTQEQLEPMLKTCLEEVKELGAMQRTNFDTFTHDPVLSQRLKFLESAGISMEDRMKELNPQYVRQLTTVKFSLSEGVFGGAIPEKREDTATESIYTFTVTKPETIFSVRLIHENVCAGVLKKGLEHYQSADGRVKVDLVNGEMIVTVPRDAYYSLDVGSSKYALHMLMESQSEMGKAFAQLQNMVTRRGGYLERSTLNSEEWKLEVGGQRYRVNMEGREVRIIRRSPNGIVQEVVHTVPNMQKLLQNFDHYFLGAPKSVPDSLTQEIVRKAEQAGFTRLPEGNVFDSVDFEKLLSENTFLLARAACNARQFNFTFEVKDGSIINPRFTAMRRNIALENYPLTKKHIEQLNIKNLTADWYKGLATAFEKDLQSALPETLKTKPVIPGAGPLEFYENTSSVGRLGSAKSNIRALSEKKSGTKYPVVMFRLDEKGGINKILIGNANRGLEQADVFPKTNAFLRRNYLDKQLKPDFLNDAFRASLAKVFADEVEALLPPGLRGKNFIPMKDKPGWFIEASSLSVPFGLASFEIACKISGNNIEETILWSTELKKEHVFGAAWKKTNQYLKEKKPTSLSADAFSDRWKSELQKAIQEDYSRLLGGSR